MTSEHVPARQTSSRPTARRDAAAPDPRAGFALVLSLLVLVGVSTLAAAGVWLARADSRTAMNQRAASRAFHMAEAAMSRFLGEESGVPTTPRTYTFPEGSAEITSRRLGVFAGGHEMYRLRARAQLDDSPSTTRSVTTLAMVDPLALEFPGGLASGNNIRKDGTSGLVSGEDGASEDACPVAKQPARPGVVAEDYEQKGGSGGGTNTECTVSSDGPICGEPPIVETSDPLGSMDIDWQGIRDGTAVDFDHVVDDVANWPSVDSDEWPVIYVDNESPVSLSDAAGHSGKGILIIEGDVKLEGDFHWDGALMIGGALKSAGNNVIEGGTVAGLNELLGIAEEDTDLGNGEKTFQYHSCNLLRAMREAGKLHEVPGSWREEI